MNGVNQYFPLEHQLLQIYIWLMLVINNNVTPWLSMKNKQPMLALIVHVRRQVKRMDVYLQQLINELK